MGEARQRKHEYITLEHLLFALTEDRDAVAVLKACGVDGDLLKSDLTSYMDEVLNDMVSQDNDIEATPTAGFQPVVQREVLHVQSSGRTETNGAMQNINGEIQNASEGSSKPAHKEMVK